MRTTVTLDDELLARAEELTGVRERSALIRDAVEGRVQLSVYPSFCLKGLMHDE